MKRDFIRRFTSIALLAAASVVGGSAPADDAEEALLQRGEQIYRESCQQCHGEQGQGVEEHYADALVGDLSVGGLQEVIAETMPEDDPEACVGEEAKAVAQFIHHAFYSEAARVRNRPPRAVLTRLTGEQLRQSLTDLYSHFQDQTWVESRRGVQASYFDGSRWSKEKLKTERVDPVIQFDFGKESPVEGVSAEEFYIQWSGSLKVDQTGRYELVLRSSLSCMLKFGADNRELVNNHVQSEGKEEFRRTLMLTAGREYPFSLEFIQRKRKTEQPPARVSLAWIPPHGIEEIIPNRYLIPSKFPPTFSLQTKLPPDDRSYGYERGTAINPEWDQSTTDAAVEFAQVAIDELYPRYRRRHRDDSDEDRAKLRGFLTEVIQTAFRGPLDDELRKRYIDDQLALADDDGEAIRRSLLISLKSPRFLYPLLDVNRSQSQQTGNRLALILYDSLPADPWLRDKIQQDQLVSQEQIAEAAWKMVNDYRCRAKVRSFLYQWFDLADLEDPTKDPDLFPGFDPILLHDLRASLDTFLESVVWSEGSDFRQLVQADWAMTTPRIESFYGPAWKPAQEKQADNESVKPASPDSDAGDPASEKSNVAGSDDAESDGGEADENREGSDDPGRGDQPDDGKEDAGGDQVVRHDDPVQLAAEPVRSVSQREIHVGVLTHPLLMSHLAYHQTSSPIHRGVFLTRHTLGRVLRPPNAAFTPLSPELHPNLTTRQRVELQTGEVNCQVCHQKINSLGFTLEAFDAVGRFRQKEKEHPIDGSGSYITRSGETQRFEGARQLGDFLAASEDCHRAFVESAFEHFVKQPIAAFGPDVADRLTRSFQESGFNIQQLIVSIAQIAAVPPPPPSST